MQSYIKKSTLIREFRRLVKGKKPTVLQQLDSSFFKILNQVFVNKPHDIKFHITKENSMVFNIDYPKNINVYLEQFYDNINPTLLNITKNEEQICMIDEGLDESLTILNYFMENDEMHDSTDYGK